MLYALARRELAWYDSRMDDIASALRSACDANGWSATKLGASIDSSHAAAQRWLKGTATPPGDKLEKLRRVLPGLAERLDAREVA